MNFSQYHCFDCQLSCGFNTTPILTKFFSLYKIRHSRGSNFKYRIVHVCVYWGGTTIILCTWVSPICKPNIVDIGRSKNSKTENNIREDFFSYFYQPPSTALCKCVHTQAHAVSFNPYNSPGLHMNICLPEGHTSSPGKSFQSTVSEW